MGVEFISSCACMAYGYIPSCTMFNRVNSNVKLASSSRVEVLERSSARVRGVRSSSEARVRVLECSSFTH